MALPSRATCVNVDEIDAILCGSCKIGARNLLPNVPQLCWSLQMIDGILAGVRAASRSSIPEYAPSAQLALPPREAVLPSTTRYIDDHASPIGLVSTAPSLVASTWTVMCEKTNSDGP